MKNTFPQIDETEPLVEIEIWQQLSMKTNKMETNNMHH